MTGATPEERGEQTQPMAVPTWSRVAGGWPGSRAERGPYADADTVDELDAVVTDQAGTAAPGTAPSSAASHAAALPGTAAPGPALAWLWGEQGQAGEYLLTSHSITVGRDRGNDIVLSDATVGREHAKIENCDGQWWLQPTASAGPTWVNGQPVEPGQRCRVTDGDRLRFGFHTQFRLLVPSAR